MTLISEHFILFVLVGFVAQFIKGSIGMAFGVISSAFLLNLGIPPVFLSASVHTASIATTATSGLSHILFRNVDFLLFRRLVIPGVIGSVAGAFLLTKIPVGIARPVLAVYLLSMGCIILYNALSQIISSRRIPAVFIKKILRDQLPSEHVTHVVPLATAGGFCDSLGGGGWGHIITSTLLAQGATPHYVIGTVNTVQFFIAVSASTTFFFTVGIQHWTIIIALITGGVLAAPLAAYLVRRVNPVVIMAIAGCIVTSLSLRTLLTIFN